MISERAWRQQVGVSAVTAWRWKRAGWLTPININGRPFFTREELDRFQVRAAAGEFSKKPAGAAAKRKGAV